MTFRKIAITLLALATSTLLAACGDAPTPGAPATPAATYPQGRVVVANQNGDVLTVIDVATNLGVAIVPTGKLPHHVLSTPDGKELWVTLYGENRLQVFDANTLKEIASVDVGSPNDDLIFSPSGDRLYVSLGQKDEVKTIDTAKRSVLGTVKVGKTPHGLRVTPDGKYLLATNTLDNTLSLINLQGEAKLEENIKTGVNPFEVIVTEDGATAYVSNFLADSISVVDLAQRKTVGYIRTGKKPAMIALDQTSGQQVLWVSNTGSNDLWKVDAVTRKLIKRIPVGKGAHGALLTPDGKLFVTNTEDGTVTVVDKVAGEPIVTIPAGNYPNGLTYVPAALASGSK